MPQVRARDICETALELIGVAAAEQPIAAPMADRALAALNTMIDAWATERLLTYTRPHYALTLEPGRRTYSWGLVPGEPVEADISAPAPVRLEIALLNIGGSPEQEWPLHILTQAEYEQGIWQKFFASDYPGAVYLAMSQPYHVLAVYGVPAFAYTLRLFPWQAAAPYEHWDHALPWPNGYQEAFEYNLAVRLAPRYAVPVSPDIRLLAEESKRALYVPNVDVGRLSLRPGRPVGGTALGLPRGFREGWG